MTPRRGGPPRKRRGHFDPENFDEAEESAPPELDLHGLPPDRALERLRLFLHASRVAGESTVIAITGAGRSNATGTPVLRSRVEAWLAGETGKSLGVGHVERVAKGGALSIRIRRASPRSL